MEEPISGLHTSEFHDGFLGRNVPYNQTKEKSMPKYPSKAKHQGELPINQSPILIPSDRRTKKVNETGDTKSDMERGDEEQRQGVERGGGHGCGCAGWVVAAGGSQGSAAVQAGPEGAGGAGSRGGAVRARW